jgi:hypothetical protein
MKQARVQYQAKFHGRSPWHSCIITLATVIRVILVRSTAARLSGLPYLLIWWLWLMAGDGIGKDIPRPCQLSRASEICTTAVSESTLDENAKGN